MWIDRDIEPLIAEVATLRPAVVVTGSRQAGKTSLLERLFPEARYQTLITPARGYVGAPGRLARGDSIDFAYL